jgi:hypothetical protein
MSAESEDPAQHAVARLEAALERIATLAAAARDTGADAGSDTPPAPSDLPVQEVAARLDALIAQLRAVLGPASA